MAWAGCCLQNLNGGPWWRWTRPTPPSTSSSCRAQRAMRSRPRHASPPYAVSPTGTAAQAWRAPTTYATPPRRRSDRRGVLAGVVAVVLVVAVALVAPQSLGLGLGAVPAVAAPPRPADAAAQRLLPAVLAPAGRGGWRPLAQDPATGEVLRFDPCRPLHYVVRAGLEPPGAPAPWTPPSRSSPRTPDSSWSPTEPPPSRPARTVRRSSRRATATAGRRCSSPGRPLRSPPSSRRCRRLRRPAGRARRPPAPRLRPGRARRGPAHHPGGGPQPGRVPDGAARAPRTWWDSGTSRTPSS